MDQNLSKCLGRSEGEKGEEEEPLVGAAASIPGIPVVGGVPVAPNPPNLPFPARTIPRNDSALPPSGVATSAPTASAVETRSNEPISLAPEVRLNQSPFHPNSPTVSQPTASAPEVVLPPNEAANRPIPSRKRRDQVSNSLRSMSNHSVYRNFWTEAEASLSKEYKVPEQWRTAMTDGEPGGIVVGLVNAKMEECKDKQWKIRVNGEEVVVRDLFKKTLDWIKKFAAVGDTVVQYDPVHAALPWAGFRFLLQVHHFRCFLFTSLERMRLISLDSWLSTRRRPMVQCWPV
jgi:hypothetical protein